MRKLFVSVFFVTLVSVGAPAPAGDTDRAMADPDLAATREQNRQLRLALPRTARWLLEHPDPRKRAAGLLYSVGRDSMLDAQAAIVESMATDERLREHGSIRQSGIDALAGAEARSDELSAFEPGVLVARFEQAIRTTTDGAALAWLAAACASADIEAFCVDAGLDDAIVRHDGANVFSRLALFPGAEADNRDRLIIETENTRNYVSQLAATWFKALDEGPAAALLETPFEKLGGAFANSMAYGIPAYQPVTMACRADIAPGGELDRACDRIAEKMISDSQTLIGQMVGFSLASARAGARGDQATVALLDQRKVFENAVHSCRATALLGDLETIGESDAREFMDMLGKHGELEAWARLAAQHGIDCSDPGDPTADAMEEYARQLEGDS